MTILSLKVSLRSGAYAGSPWEAVIEIESSASLGDLHFAIQDAVGFDDDHLFEFFIARTETSRDRVCFDDESGQLDETSLESLFPLPERKSLYYLFDYGDSWLFKVTKVNRAAGVPDPLASYPRLVRESGTRPEQYPDFDEDDEDDEDA